MVVTSQPVVVVAAVALDAELASIFEISLSIKTLLKGLKFLLHSYKLLYHLLDRRRMLLLYAHFARKPQERKNLRRVPVPVRLLPTRQCQMRRHLLLQEKHGIFFNINQKTRINDRFAFVNSFN